MTTCSSEVGVLADSLLEWWSKNKRKFPWRETSDPYANLIAEILLRRTTARQVANVFVKFLSKYPSPVDLLNARIANLEKDLKPLGIYKVRAVQLKQIATALANDYNGEVPASREALLQLPGIHFYSANAVLCFAYGKKEPIVDTNVARVLQRVFGIGPMEKRISANDPRLWSLSLLLVHRAKPRELNWALLDFAAKVCTARKPRCDECPLTCISAHRRHSMRRK